MRSLFQVGLDELKHHTLDVSNNRLASGLDPEESLAPVTSDVLVKGQSIRS
jgi:hypothetical protein